MPAWCLQLTVEILTGFVEAEEKFTPVIARMEREGYPGCAHSIPDQEEPLLAQLPGCYIERIKQRRILYEYRIQALMKSMILLRCLSQAGQTITRPWCT